MSEDFKRNSSNGPSSVLFDLHEAETSSKLQVSRNMAKKGAFFPSISALRRRKPNAARSCIDLCRQYFIPAIGQTDITVKL